MKRARNHIRQVTPFITERRRLNSSPEDAVIRDWDKAPGIGQAVDRAQWKDPARRRFVDPGRGITRT